MLLDARGARLAPMIAWHDARGKEEAPPDRERPRRRAVHGATGVPASPLCSLAKWAGWRSTARRARAAKRWLNVAEWVVRRLGGRDVAELSLASRTGLLDLPGRTPFEEALAWAGLPGDLLGELWRGHADGHASSGAVLPGAGAPS